ncbi:MAG: hypothetical protein FGM57_01420 [Candidatus Taylorbacteria bacterium]|nr:hypothetical protein [Candidatus Taylorbacteria bacterium]
MCIFLSTPKDAVAIDISGVYQSLNSKKIVEAVYKKPVFELEKKRVFNPDTKTQVASISEVVRSVFDKLVNFGSGAIEPIYTRDRVTETIKEKETNPVNNVARRSVSLPTYTAPTSKQVDTVLSTQLNQLRKRVSDLELARGERVLVQPVTQNIYNTYTTSGGTYSIPSSDTTSSRQVVNDIELALAPLREQITALGSSSPATSFSTSSARASVSVSGGVLTYDQSSGVLSFSTSSLSTSDLVEGTNLYFTDSRVDARINAATSTIQAMVSTSTVRSMFSTSVAGLSYDNSTGLTSLTSGYAIPFTASTTEWALAYASTTNISAFWNTPSTRITAGTGLSWSGNTLTNSGVTSIGGLTGDVSTSSLGITSSQWVTSGSNIYYSGNVGIGTSSPSADLAIKMQSPTSRGFILQTASGQSSNIFEILDSSYVQRFYITPSYAVYMNVSNGTFSTSSPALTVKQTAMFDSGSSSTIAVAIKGRTGQTADLQQWLDVNNSILGVVTANGGLGIGTSTPAARLSVTGVSGATDPIFTVASSTNSALLSVSSAGTVAVGTLNINQAGSITTTSGNIHIGPMSGLTTLGAQHAINITHHALSANGQIGWTQYTNNATAGTYDAGISRAFTGALEINSGTTGTWRDLIVRNLSMGTTSTSTTLFVQAQAGKDVVDFASSTGPSLFRITQAGDVGIGTSTPGYALTVAGDINLTGGFRINGDSGTSGMVLQSTGTGAQWVATSSLGVTPSQWVTSGNDISYSIGNVGVGTSTPVARLSVLGASGATTELFRLASSTNAGVFTVAANGDTSINSLNGLSVTSSSSSGIVISLRSAYASGGNITVGGAGNVAIDNLSRTGYGSFQIDQGGGNISVMVSEAAQTLALRNGSTAGNFRLYNTYSSATNYERGAFNWDTNVFRIGTENSGTGSGRSLAFMTSSTTRMTIDTSGNVGIGTTSPVSTLAVVGTSTISGGVNILGSAGSFLVRDTTLLLAASTTQSNIYVGGAGNTGASGSSNTAIGFTALQSVNSSSANNVAVGRGAGMLISSGQRNIAVGMNALDASTSGPDNVAIGYDALTAISTSISNTAVGSYALNSLTSGHYNVALGMKAGYTLTGGTGNIVIGSGNNGDGVSTPSSSSNYTLNIGGVLWGTNMNTVSGASIAAGNIGVGTSTPIARFAVTGASGATTDLLTIASSTNARLLNMSSAGVLTVGQAGNISGQLIVGQAASVNANITIGGSVNQTISGSHNTLGSTWQIVTDTTGSGGPADFRLGSTGKLAFGNATANIGTLDTSISRISSGVLGIGTGAQGSSAGTLLAGNIGIGTSTPAFPLDVYSTVDSYQTYGWLNSSGGTGTSAGTNSYSIRAQGRILASEFNAVSDARLKDVQFDLDSTIALDAISKLQPVSFTWKNNPTGQPVLGFLAQDVELAIPNAVSKISTDLFSDQRELSYNQITAVMVGAVKELKNQLDTLKSGIENMVAWFKDGGQKFNVNGDICVDDVCVTKDQFKQMLIHNAGAAPYTAPIENATSSVDTPPVETSSDSEPVADSAPSDSDSATPVADQPQEEVPPAETTANTAISSNTEPVTTEQ